MITLFGATGYTGRLIAHHLDQSGLPFRISGRSPEKLAALSATLASRPVCITADATQPASLPPLFRETKVFINCAGPFTDLGEKVISQAAVNGVHYLDITNELGFVYRAQTYSKLAQQNRAVLIPACGFEVALADFAAAHLARVLPGPYREAHVTYHLPGKGSSVGTRRSALRSLATSWIVYRDGQWTGQTPGNATCRTQLSAGQTAALSFPSSESITFPAHLDVQNVYTWMTTSFAGRIVAPVLIPFFSRVLRSVLRDPILSLASISPPPSTGLRSLDPFEIKVTLCNPQESRAVSITGKGAYDLTAHIIGFAAKRLSNEPQVSFGCLPPSALGDPNVFFETAATWGVSVDEVASD